MLRVLFMCCAVAFGGAFLAGCSGDEQKHEDAKACAACDKAGAGHMCADCQKKMWAKCAEQCADCKKMGEGKMCDMCQKKMRAACDECREGGKDCPECKDKGACSMCKADHVMCAECQKKMWPEASKKCEKCKAAGEGHICADCQKAMCK